MSSEHDVRLSTVHEDVSRSAFIMPDRDPLGSSISKTVFVCVQRRGLSARARIFPVYLCAGCAFVSKHVRCVRDTVHRVVQRCSLTMLTGCAQIRDTDFLSGAVFCLRDARWYTGPVRSEKQRCQSSVRLGKSSTSSTSSNAHSINC
jgi:hypothetical protein